MGSWFTDPKFLRKCWDSTVHFLSSTRTLDNEAVALAWFRGIEVALNNSGYEIVPKQNNSPKETPK